MTSESTVDDAADGAVHGGDDGPRRPAAVAAVAAGPAPAQSLFGRASLVSGRTASRSELGHHRPPAVASRTPVVGPAAHTPVLPRRETEQGVRSSAQSARLCSECELSLECRAVLGCDTELRCGTALDREVRSTGQVQCWRVKDYTI